MKRVLIFVVTVFLFLVVLSCHKEKDPNNAENSPVWLQQKITELIPEQNLCEITTVTTIEYNGKKYYHIYCAIWSCMYCQLFDEQGNRPAWDANGWNDFFAKKKDIQTVPACQ